MRSPCHNKFLLFSKEALQEKATLQSSVYEHLNTISSLRSQLESRRHTPTEPQSNEELMNVQEALELKEQEVNGAHLCAVAR